MKQLVIGGLMSIYEAKLLEEIRRSSEYNKKSIIEMEYIGIHHQRQFNSFFKGISPNYSPDVWLDQGIDNIYRTLTGENLISDDGLRKLSSCMQKFERAMDHNLLFSLHNNAATLKRILDLRKGDLGGELRLCVKINLDVGAGEDSAIITELFRIPDSQRFKNFQIGENSGFIEVSKEAKPYYECNDIVKYSNPNYINIDPKKHYKNRRLCQNSANQYRDGVNAGSIDGNAYPDINWNQCWDVSDDASGDDNIKGSAYKSTVIVPICFGGTEYANEFKGSWDRKGGGAVRVVYAYLCLDHSKANYFEESSISLARIFAENMATFFFLRERWSSKSLTLQVVRGIIACSEHASSGIPVS